MCPVLQITIEGEVYDTYSGGEAVPFTIGEDEQSPQLALPTPLSTPTHSGRSVHGWFAEDARGDLSLLPDRSVLHTVDEKNL